MYDSMMKYTDSESDNVDDEMQINLYENPINRESLEKIRGTNTTTKCKLIYMRTQ